jgi:hypothetical protein
MNGFENNPLFFLNILLFFVFFASAQIHRVIAYSAVAAPAKSSATKTSASSPVE